MNKLLELMKDFTVSRPVFRLKLSNSGDHVGTNINQPVHKYQPVPIKGDFLSEIVCENYSETFDTSSGCFAISKNEIARRSIEDIRGNIARFIEQNLEMRNPRQSKLYRWTYRNMPHNDEVNDVLIMVYKYLRSFSDITMKASDTSHIKNGIAILEAIMEKHEQ